MELGKSRDHLDIASLPEFLENFVVLLLVNLSLVVKDLSKNELLNHGLVLIFGGVEVDLIDDGFLLAVFLMGNGRR